MGKFKEGFAQEFLWLRPLFAGKFTYTELRNGTITLVDLLKQNALMDYEDAISAVKTGKNK